MVNTKELKGEDKKDFDDTWASPRRRDLEYDTNKHQVMKHSYKITRWIHSENEPCNSPYCGVCYDKFIPDFLEEQQISKDLGLIKKLCQSSIKRLEDRYGFNAYVIFRNRIKQTQYQQKLKTVQDLIKSGIKNCPDAHNEDHVHDRKCI